MKIHLVTYGDALYKNLKEAFIESAIKSSFFNEIHSFSNLDIDPKFDKEIYTPFKLCRGGGYWIWKPYFVKKVLDTLEENDILIYCDAGSRINKNGKRRFEEYINMASHAKTGTVDFGLYWREYQFTKQEVFDHFNSPLEIINSSQLVGGILILKKCSHSTMLVNKWHDTAVNYPFLFTDEKRVPQSQKFIDHRHDQSIFSVIRKTYGANIIMNETAFSDYSTDAQRFPFWAMQLKA